MSGEYDSIGTGTTIWRGAITPSGPMTLAFGPGEWNNQITGWNSTATNTVTNTGTMPIPQSTSFAAAGFTNAGTVDQATARVTIVEGGSITNTGTWRLTDNSDMWGTGGVAVEHFVNSGTLDKATGTGTAFIGTNNVRVDNTGIVRASAGTLDLVAGTWPATILQAATDAVLDIQFDTTSVVSGTFDVTGGGTTIWRGAITPSGPMTLAFGPGEWNNQITGWNSTATNTVTNTGTMPIPLSTSFAAAGFTNAGTVDQATARVTIVRGWVDHQHRDVAADRQLRHVGHRRCRRRAFRELRHVGQSDRHRHRVHRHQQRPSRQHRHRARQRRHLGPRRRNMARDDPADAATDGVVDIQFDTTSAVSGAFDVTGGGTTIWRGAITPSGPMTLAFGPGEWNNQITVWGSTATNTVTNTGTMPITHSTSFAPAGFTNAGIVDQATARVTIVEGGSITNTGTWRLTDNSDMWGTGGVAVEHFVNSGTLDKATGTGTAFIGTNNVRVDNTGIVRASAGTLDLLAGTWPGTVIDTAAGGIVDIQFDATSVLSGEYDLIGDGSTTGVARSCRLHRSRWRSSRASSKAGSTTGTRPPPTRSPTPARCRRSTRPIWVPGSSTPAR